MVAIYHIISKKEKMTQTIKQTFSDKTFYLAKALHNINNAKSYLEEVKRNSANDAKSIFGSYVNKCEWIINDLRSRLNRESAEAFNKDLEDSLFFEAIQDKLIRLDKNTRDIVENYIDELIKNAK